MTALQSVNPALSEAHEMSLEAKCMLVYVSESHTACARRDTAFIYGPSMIRFEIYFIVLSSDFSNVCTPDP